jgi:predicted CopG family antitoxin
MNLVRTISLDEETYENWELIRKRSGETYSQSVRRLINERAKQLTQPRRRMNKRMRMEELEGTEKDGNV